MFGPQETQVYELSLTVRALEQQLQIKQDLLRHMHESQPTEYVLSHPLQHPTTPHLSYLLRQRLREELLAPQAAARQALEDALHEARDRIANLQQRLVATNQDAALQLQQQRDAAQHEEAQHRLVVAELRGAHELAVQELST